MRSLAIEFRIGCITAVGAIEPDPVTVFGLTTTAVEVGMGERKPTVNLRDDVHFVLTVPRMTGRHADVAASVARAVVGDTPLVTKVEPSREDLIGMFDCND